jgi:hypothetical protein
MKIKSLVIVSLVGVLLSGCEVVGGLAVQSAQTFLFEKPIEISPALKNAVTIENATWKKVGDFSVSYGFTATLPKPCKYVSYRGKAYAGDVLLTSWGNVGQKQVDAQANQKIKLVDHFPTANNDKPDRVTLDAFTCN